MSSSRVQISFTGRLHLLGDERTLRGVVADGAPAEAAAHVALVEVHLLLRDAKRLCHRLAQFIRCLTAFPDLGRVARLIEANHGVQRLHLGVIAVVAAELRLVRLCRVGEGCLHITLLFELRHLGIGIVMELDVVRERLLRVEAICFRLGPGHLQRIAAGLGALEVIGNDSQAVRKLDDGDDAFPRFDLRVIPVFWSRAGLILLSRIPDARLRAMHGGMQRRRIDHARQFHIDGVLRRAVDLGGNVAPRNRVADETELRAFLELLRVDHRQCRGDRAECGDLAICQALTTRRVDHDARLSLETGRINSPLLRGIRNQHLANLGAGHAQLGIIQLHGAAADDPHQLLGAERILVAINLRVGRDPLDRDLRPIRVHFLRNDERQ